MRTIYVWKCEDCGDNNHRTSNNEPLRCTTCGSKGVQAYKGTLAKIKERRASTNSVSPKLLYELEKCATELECLPSAAVLPIAKRINAVVAQLQA